MKFEFNLTEEDALALSEECIKYSKPEQTAKLWYRISIPIICLLLVIKHKVLDDNFYWPLALLFIVIGVLFYIYDPIAGDRANRKIILKDLKKPKIQKNLGEYTLVLDEEQFHSYGPMGDTTYKWNAVEKLEETESYLILVLVDSSTIPVPKSQISEVELNELKALVEKKLNLTV